MVADGKLQQSANTEIVKYTLSDSGASSYFLIKGSLAVIINIAEFPITIKLPDGSIIWSTHTCNLDIPRLPHKMIEAHIVPGLVHSSLVSTKKFCEAGCMVVFDKE